MFQLLRKISENGMFTLHLIVLIEDSPQAIMSGANSAPVFEQRAKELGLPEDLIDSLKAAHVNSFARLAYLTPYQPGQPDDQVLFDKLEEIATRHLHDFEKACFRQLFYEASAITVSLAERMHRMENRKTNLSGVHFSVYTEPSNKLVDQYFQMMADQQLVWLPWSKLASRSDELQLNKKDLQLVFDSQGNLKMSKKETEALSDLKGEIQIRQALRRRSLAVDLTGLIDFQIQETWHEKMFECLAKQSQLDIVKLQWNSAKKLTRCCGPCWQNVQEAM